MIRKWKLLLVGVSCVMGTAMAQNNPILLFPKGAPGETTKLIEKAAFFFCYAARLLSIFIFKISLVFSIITFREVILQK